MCGTEVLSVLKVTKTEEYLPALPAVDLQISRALVSPVAVGKYHVIVISCPYKLYLWCVLWDKHRTSCGNILACKPAAEVPLASNLTSGLQLVKPCYRHCGRTQNPSAFFPGMWWWNSLGENKISEKMSYFCLNSASSNTWTLGYCLKTTWVYYCFFSGAFMKKSVSWEPSLCKCCWHHQCPACPDSKEQHPKFNLLFFATSCCVEFVSVNIMTFKAGALFSFFCQCSINHCVNPTHVWSFYALSTM